MENNRIFLIRWAEQIKSHASKSKAMISYVQGQTLGDFQNCKEAEKELSAIIGACDAILAVLKNE